MDQPRPLPAVVNGEPRGIIFIQPEYKIIDVYPSSGRIPRPGYREGERIVYGPSGLQIQAIRAREEKG